MCAWYVAGYAPHRSIQRELMTHVDMLRITIRVIHMLSIRRCSSHSSNESRVRIRIRRLMLAQAFMLILLTGLRQMIMSMSVRMIIFLHPFLTDMSKSMMLHALIMPILSSMPMTVSRTDTATLPFSLNLALTLAFGTTSHASDTCQLHSMFIQLLHSTHSSLLRRLLTLSSRSLPWTSSPDVIVPHTRLVPLDAVLTDGSFTVAFQFTTAAEVAGHY